MTWIENMKNIIMKRLFYLLILTISFLGCHQKSLFPEKRALTGKSLNLRDSLNQTTRIFAWNNKLYVKDFDGTHFILVYDLLQKKFSRWITKGEAPHEALSVQSLGIHNNQLYIFDTGNQNIKMYNTDNGAFISGNGRIKPYTTLFARPINDSLSVGCPYSDSIRVIMFDNTGKTLIKNYEYPFESSFSASYAHMFAMMNDIVVHPAEHKFAMATQYASALQIFEWNEKYIRLLIEKDMEAPEYDMKDNSFQVNNRTKWGYLSSSGDEQFIYLLYSGAVQSQVKNPCVGNHIHVFDWDGNAIAELEVPEMLSAISVCNQKLYGIQSDDSFGYEIMEYDLKTLNLK